MSRIGNRELTVPENVTVTNENGCITVNLRCLAKHF